jgi:hypothetical protein
MFISEVIVEIKKILENAKDVWGPQKLTLSEIIVRMGKILGDICKWKRNSPKDRETHNDYELKKELGNLIFSTIKWCDELGYDPEECIEIAKKTQKNSVSKLR